MNSLFPPCFFGKLTAIRGYDSFIPGGRVLSDSADSKR